MYRDDEQQENNQLKCTLADEQLMQVRIVALQEAVKMFELKRESAPVMDLANLNFAWLIKPFK